MAAVAAEVEAKKKRRSARPDTEERAIAAPRPSNGAAAGMPLFLYPPSTAGSARSNGHGEIESAQPQAGESREEIVRRAVPAAPARSNGHDALPPAPGAASAAPQPEAAQPPAAPTPETAGPPPAAAPPVAAEIARPPAPTAAEAGPAPSASETGPAPEAARRLPAAPSIAEPPLPGAAPSQIGAPPEAAGPITPTAEASRLPALSESAAGGPATREAAAAGAITPVAGGPAAAAQVLAKGTAGGKPASASTGAEGPAAAGAPAAEAGRPGPVPGPEASTAAEGEAKPAEGEAKPAEGEAKPAEGEAKPAEAGAEVQEAATSDTETEQVEPDAAGLGGSGDTERVAGEGEASGGATVAESSGEASETVSEAGGGSEPGAGPSDDTDLINQELAEHERWAGSFGEMGTAGSDERARFLLDQAGQGAVSGAAGGASMGFVMGAIGAGVGQIAGRRLATLAVSRGASVTPIPGLGPAIGGVMAVAGLAMRDWGASAETISRMGTGEGYAGLANDLEGIAEVLDIATQVMDVLAGVLGGIAVGMWVATVLSAGVLSPLALTLSAIATGITIATTAIGVIINVVVRPTVTALRALHTFESQGDPAQIEAEGQQLQAAAGQVTGAVAGAVAGRAGGRAGARGGTRADRAITGLQARRTGGRPAMSATSGPGPRLHVEVPEAPTRVEAGTEAAPARPVNPAEGAPSTSRPAATEGPVAASPAGGPRPEESFADLADVVADLNASPELAARLTDTRAPLQPRATAWGPGEARAYGNVQAAQHRAQTGMTGGDVQAGHTAAARHARESGISEADWNRQQWMDLHSRRGQGLDVTVTDQNGRTRTRTRHSSQELIIDAAVERSRQASGGELTPQGQLDAADYVAWVTENTPYRQQDVEAIRTGGLAPPESGPAVDPATGRVIPPGPSASSPTARSGGGISRSTYASHTETMPPTPDRAAAMAQYHAQIAADSGRESGVWRDARGDYHVMQGDQGSVAPPSAPRPLELIYHSHPTETGAAQQGLGSQPSQAGGDIGVLQYQHAQGPAGRRQGSELHFPTYDASGAHTGYGTTRFAYDPTHPLPLQVETTLPDGRSSRQRYGSFADYEQRTGVGPRGETQAEAATAFSSAEAQLTQDITAAQQNIGDIVGRTRTRPIGLPAMREAGEFGRQMAQGEEQAGESSDRPARGPAYTASVPGLEPGESTEIPINPAYPEPPGTTAELEVLLEQVGVAQEAGGELASTEMTMTAQADQQRTHGSQLVEAQAVTEDLAAGRTAHQASVDSTEGTNAEQQSTAEDAISTLGRSAEEATALATLVGSLRMFQGMAHLFSYLPGDLGRSAERARDDAGGLITTLNRVSEAEGVQSNVEGGRSTIIANEQRIQTVSDEGQQTDTELMTGQEQVAELEGANAASLAETESVQQQATAERQDAAASAEEAHSAHDDLFSRLQAWAPQHRQAREVAIEEGASRLRALGYEVSEE